MGKWSDQIKHIMGQTVIMYICISYFCSLWGKMKNIYMNDWLKPSKTTDVLVNLYAMDAIILQTEKLDIIVLHYKKFWSFTEIKVDTSHNCTKSESFQGDKISCWKSWLQQTLQTVLGADSFICHLFHQLEEPLH